MKAKVVAAEDAVLAQQLAVQVAALIVWQSRKNAADVKPCMICIDISLRWTIRQMNKEPGPTPTKKKSCRESAAAAVAKRQRIENEQSMKPLVVPRGRLFITRHLARQLPQPDQVFFRGSLAAVLQGGRFALPR